MPMPSSHRLRLRLLAGALLVSLTALPVAAQPAAAGANPASPASPASTATAPPLAVQLTMQRVLVDAQGREQLVPAAQVRPGDLLEYRGTYTNRSSRPLGEVQATLPVPAHTTYQADGVSPSGVFAARADGRHAPAPLMQRVRDAAGRESLQPVPLAEYRSLRWSLRTLDPGQSTTVRARVRVDADAPPSVAALASPAAR